MQDLFKITYFTEISGIISAYQEAMSHITKRNAKEEQQKVISFSNHKRITRRSDIGLNSKVTNFRYHTF